MTTQPICDYANYPHSGGGTNHGPAVTTRGGYHICQACCDAIVQAERDEATYYNKQNEEWLINERSRLLQAKCFL